MKIELLIADDTELRNAVRDLIKAEVLSIARAEIRDIISEVVGEKVASNTRLDALAEKVIREEVARAIGNTVGNTWDYRSSETIKALAREEINKRLNDVWKDGKMSI